MTKNFRKTLGATLLGLAAVCSAPTASAAIVTGNWDPILPSPFVDLGWVATINVLTPTNCTNTASIGMAVNIFGTTFRCETVPNKNDFSVARAQVGFYRVSTGRIVEIMEFSPPATFRPDLKLYGEQLFLDFSDASEQSATPATLGLNFKLGLLQGLPVLSYQDRGASGPFTVAPYTPVRTGFQVNPDNNQLQSVLTATAYSPNQQVASPTAIPEPGSMALVLLALGAAGAAASRRTRRVHHTA